MLSIVSCALIWWSQRFLSLSDSFQFAIYFVQFHSLCRVLRVFFGSLLLLLSCYRPVTGDGCGQVCFYFRLFALMTCGLCYVISLLYYSHISFYTHFFWPGLGVSYKINSLGSWGISTKAFKIWRGGKCSVAVPPTIHVILSWQPFHCFYWLLLP